MPALEDVEGPSEPGTPRGEAPREMLYQMQSDFATFIKPIAEEIKKSPGKTLLEERVEGVPIKGGSLRIFEA